MSASSTAARSCSSRRRSRSTRARRSGWSGQRRRQEHGVPADRRRGAGPTTARSSGPRKLTLGYFRQDVGELRGRSILAETCAGAGEVAELADELADLTAQLEVGGDDLDRVVERYADVEARYSELGGYELEGRAHAILAGLGFAPERAGDDVGTLSGGWKMRVALAQILLASPTCCSSTSRPTTSTSSRSCGSSRSSPRLPGRGGDDLPRSRDHEPLVTKIVEIDGGTARTYTGNYAFYERARAEASARYEAEYARQQAMLAKESRFIERFAAHAAKAAQVASRVKKLDKIEKLAPPRRIIEKASASARRRARATTWSAARADARPTAPHRSTPGCR
jgi:ATPase subunit of ABC transporter with duplicated ATPase domains